MSKYNIEYYHGMSGVGHFYVKFEGEIDQNNIEGQRFFGKNPKVNNIPIWEGEITDEFTYHESLKKLGITPIYFSQEVTKEQFLAAYKEAINQRDEGSGIYHGTQNNCISFNQDIYRSTGAKGHFINNFERGSLEASGTLASKEVLSYYESITPKIVTGVSKEQIAKEYGVDVNRIVQNNDLSVMEAMGFGAYGNNMEDYFFILPDPEILNKAAKQFNSDYLENPIDIINYAFDNAKSKESIKDSQNQLFKILDMFDNPEVQNQDLDNVQRFRIIAEKQRAGGNKEYANIFAGLASPTDAVLSFLGRSSDDEISSNKNSINKLEN